MLLPTATGTIHNLLPPVPCSSERRPDRLPDFAEDPRLCRDERFPTEVGEIRARFDSRLRGLGDAIRWVRSNREIQWVACSSLILKRLEVYTRARFCDK